MTEVSRDVAGKVSQLVARLLDKLLTECQFVNAGLQRIIELFREPFNPASADDVQALVTTTGEVLRLLSKIVERFRESATLPTLDPAVQDNFFSGLVDKFAQLKEAWSAGRSDDAGDSENEASHCIIFLARLLQFDLGFPGAWTARATELGTTLCKTLFDLLMVRHLHFGRLSDVFTCIVASCRRIWSGYGRLSSPLRYITLSLGRNTCRPQDCHIRPIPELSRDRTLAASSRYTTRIPHPAPNASSIRRVEPHCCWPCLRHP